MSPCIAEPPLLLKEVEIAFMVYALLIKMIHYMLGLKNMQTTLRELKNRLIVSEWDETQFADLIS